jgi:histidine triad (HIT) family protein
VSARGITRKSIFHSDCPFCDQAKIRAADIEQHFAADGSLVRVFEPLGGVTPGHVLVVPDKHVSDATEDPYTTSMVMGVAAKVAQRFPAANIITSIGSPATQTVFHLHVHVVPRYAGDGLMLPWSER